MVRAASQNPWTQQEAAACLDGLCGAPRPGIGTWGCSAGTAVGIIIPIAQMRKLRPREAAAHPSWMAGWSPELHLSSCQAT